MIATPDFVWHAKANPRRHFASPMGVVTDPRIRPSDKREILQSWRLDSRLLQTAEAENMGGGETNDLDQVQAAIRALDRI
jgi:hypothetical protein